MAATFARALCKSVVVLFYFNFNLKMSFLVYVLVFAFVFFIWFIILEYFCYFIYLWDSILGSLYCTKCDPQMSMNPEAKHLKWLAQWEAAHKTLPHNQTHTHTHTRWQASCLKSLGSNHSWMLSSAVCCFVVHVAKRPSSSQRLSEKTNPEREWNMVEGRKLWVF